MCLNPKPQTLNPKPRPLSPELEIACFNLEALSIAQAAGATRVEFCKDYTAGGTSPSREDIKSARALLKIPLHVIIRPRAGDFQYSTSEIQTMKDLILFCKEQGVDGVVFGILDAKKQVDLVTSAEFIKLAAPMKLCFHRAIDESVSAEEDIEALVKLGIDFLLTSGGEKNADLGAKTIKEWQKKFGTSLRIMPGGSLRSDNLAKIARITRCQAFHSSAITGAEILPDETEIKGLLEILKGA